MPDPIPVAASPADTDALIPAVPAADATMADAAWDAMAALLAITAAAPGGLTGPATPSTVTGALALAVRELPGLFRRLSGRSGDTYAAGQPGPCRSGRPLAAAASFWFQMEAAADAAARLSLALDAAHAAALQLREGGEDR